MAAAAGVDSQALREKVRGVVAEIVGMDALMDDTPLMQSGLTSQSAAPRRHLQAVCQLFRVKMMCGAAIWTYFRRNVCYFMLFTW